jgi:hypothetical protein
MLGQSIYYYFYYFFLNFLFPIVLFEALISSFPALLYSLFAKGYLSQFSKLQSLFTLALMPIAGFLRSDLKI